MRKQTHTILCKRLDLAKSEVLYRFDSFDPADWTTVRGSPKWRVMPDKVIGGSPDEPTHGQIFFRKPVKGDVVMEFDARIVPPSTVTVLPLTPDWDCDISLAVKTPPSVTLTVAEMALALWHRYTRPFTVTAPP